MRARTRLGFKIFLLTSILGNSPSTWASESQTHGLWVGFFTTPYPSVWSLGYRHRLKPYLHALGALGHYPYLASQSYSAGVSLRLRHPAWAFSPFVGGGADVAYQTGAIAVGSTAWGGTGLKFSYPISAGVEWINAEGLFIAWCNQYALGGTTTPSVISGVEVGVLF